MNMMLESTRIGLESILVLLQALVQRNMSFIVLLTRRKVMGQSWHLYLPRHSLYKVIIANWPSKHVFCGSQKEAAYMYVYLPESVYENGETLVRQFLSR